MCGCLKKREYVTRGRADKWWGKRDSCIAFEWRIATAQLFNSASLFCELRRNVIKLERRSLGDRATPECRLNTDLISWHQPAGEKGVAAPDVP